jgi:hypothetical protein
VAVNKITWAQVEGVTEPGRYMYKFGWLTVTVEDIGVWKQFPNAEFTLVQTLAGAREAGDEFHLGSFLAPESSE